MCISENIKKKKKSGAITSVVLISDQQVILTDCDRFSLLKIYILHVNCGKSSNFIGPGNKKKETL